MEISARRAVRGHYPASPASRVREATYEPRETQFRVGRHLAHGIQYVHVNNLSRRSESNLIARRGIIMKATGDNSSSVLCRGATTAKKHRSRQTGQRQIQGETAM